MLDLLFVYGTLRGSFDNDYARLLRAGAELIGRAAVPGSIFRLDGFPAYRPLPSGLVRGELYKLNDPEATLRELDAYEGPDFERVVINAVKDAWIYQYKKSLPEKTRILSGDFCAP
jgi:gamma-glutamylcyclotransferase (GGCT)/AIG2-like uncharacterized protein YtfP